MSNTGDIERILSDVGSTAAVVRAARRRQGLTQQALAEAAGVTRQSIVNLEKGHSSPQLTTVLAALRVLGLRLEVAPARGPSRGDAAQATTRHVRTAHDEAPAADAATSSPPPGPVDLDAVLDDLRRTEE